MAAGAIISACRSGCASRCWAKGPATLRGAGEEWASPGVLAYADGKAVGWLQAGLRAHVPEWNNLSRASTPLPDAPADDERNWAASCFFVRNGFQGKGVTGALLEGAVAFAGAQGAVDRSCCDGEPGRSAARQGSMSARQACFGAPASSRWRGRSRGGPCSGWSSRSFARSRNAAQPFERLRPGEPSRVELVFVPDARFVLRQEEQRIDPDAAGRAGPQRHRHRLWRQRVAIADRR